MMATRFQKKDSFRKSKHSTKQYVFCFFVFHTQTLDEILLIIKNPHVRSFFLVTVYCYGIQLIFRNQYPIINNNLFVTLQVFRIQFFSLLDSKLIY